ncbi:MAG TPA: hypothetical protein PK993_01580 [Clostridia bacterium]|nr:hypothetical protein [Clostridia bacterium]
MKIIENNMNKIEKTTNSKIEKNNLICKYSVEIIGKICEEINVEEVNKANIRIRNDLQEEINDTIKCNDN